MAGLLALCQSHTTAGRWTDPSEIAHCLVFEKKIQLIVACLSRSPHAPAAPPAIVHHQTSTILTAVEEISCQAFILLRDQGPSCSYLNITLLHCRFEMTGAGGISFMRALETQNALA